MPSADKGPRPGGADAYIAGLEEPRRQAECAQLLALFQEITGFGPRLWDGSMIGFGRYEYRYDSGHSGEWFLTGFAPRKKALSIHIMPGYDDYSAELAVLGKHKTGRSCLYITRLDGIDLDVLSGIVARSVERMKTSYTWHPV